MVEQLEVLETRGCPWLVTCVSVVLVWCYISTVWHYEQCCHGVIAVSVWHYQSHCISTSVAVVLCEWHHGGVSVVLVWCYISIMSSVTMVLWQYYHDVMAVLALYVAVLMCPPPYH